MAISSKDIETLWGRYQSEGVSKGVSVSQYFEANGIPYHVFEKWYKKRFRQPDVVDCVVDGVPDDAKGLCMAIPNGFDALFGGVSMRGITLSLHTAMWLKILIFNMLNMLYLFARANKYDYLCTAKVSYYGRKRTIRYRAHDNACPVCDEPYRGLVAWG